MFKKPDKRDQDMLNLLKEAGVPTKKVIGRKFEFRFCSNNASFVGIVGSIQFWVGDDLKFLQDFNKNKPVVIAPVTPFPIYDSDLIMGFLYNTEDKLWYAINFKSEEKFSGDMIFYKK